jgi:hypothetical protein
MGCVSSKASLQFVQTDVVAARSAAAAELASCIETKASAAAAEPPAGAPIEASIDTGQVHQHQPCTQAVALDVSNHHQDAAAEVDQHQQQPQQPPAAGQQAVPARPQTSAMTVIRKVMAVRWNCNILLTASCSA